MLQSSRRCCPQLLSPVTLPYTHPSFNFSFFPLPEMSLGQDAAAKRVRSAAILVISCRLMVRASISRVLLWINLDSKRNREHRQYLKEHPLLHRHHLSGRRSRCHWYQCQRSRATRRLGRYHPASLFHPQNPTEQFSFQAQVLFQPHP